MKHLNLTLVLMLVSILSFEQSIKNEEDVNRIKTIIDQKEDLKDFVISPTIFNNKGQTSAGKFSYKFIYDSVDISLVKIQVIDVEKDIQSLYFNKDQLLLFTSKEDVQYFFDADFDIPYWGAIINKLTIKRDKYKETAYRLLISFKKYSQKNLNTQK